MTDIPPSQWCQLPQMGISPIQFVSASLTYQKKSGNLTPLDEIALTNGKIHCLEQKVQNLSHLYYYKCGEVQPRDLLSMHRSLVSDFVDVFLVHLGRFLSIDEE